jgi:hypothetical protein
MYDFDTLINNVHTGSNDHKGFIWRNSDSCWKWVTAHFCFESKYDEYEEVMLLAGVYCTYPTSPSPTATPTCKPYYTWSDERATELCPSDSDYGLAEKSFGVSVCSDAESITKKQALEDTLANQFYTSCSAWCLYDYDTLRNNVDMNSNDHGGFTWKNSDSCWKWVTAGFCFESNYDEFEEVMLYAGLYCSSPTTSPTTSWNSPSPTVPQPTSTPTLEPTHTWSEERATALCPLDPDYGPADKSFGVSVCSDADSLTKQEALDKSLANQFYTHCSAWCVYDYDTLINNARTGSNDQGGFQWSNPNSCWRWVTTGFCFESVYHEFEEVQSGEQ